MIIRETGIVVGLLDDDTMALTEVESDKLQGLVDDWKENGMFTLQAGPQISKEVSGTMEVFMPFAKENLGMIENELAKAGFEVQTA